MLMKNAQELERARRREEVLQRQARTRCHTRIALYEVLQATGVSIQNMSMIVNCTKDRRAMFKTMFALLSQERTSTVVQILMTDERQHVRRDIAAFLPKPVDNNIMKLLFESPSWNVRKAFAANRALSAGLLPNFVKDESDQVRYIVAGDTSTGKEALANLEKNDPCVHVRHKAQETLRKMEREK